MSNIPRPGTPFPHTSTLSHSSRSRYAYSARPIHFPLPTIASPTPPSLLRRSSSGSSKATIQRESASSPSTPSLFKRSSSSSSLSEDESPSTPQTSEIEASSSTLPTMPLFDEEDTFELEEDYFTTEKSIPPPPPSTPAFDFRRTTTSRPSTQRRDTPAPPCSIIGTLFYNRPSKLIRPTPTRPYLSRSESIRKTQTVPRFYRTPTTSLSPSDSNRFTSVVDGGYWIVLDE